MTNADREMCSRGYRRGFQALWALQIAWLALISYSWNSSGADARDYDQISLSITVLEVVLGVLAVLLAVGSFCGFWMIRSSAQEAAREEAASIAHKVVEEAAKSIAPVARRRTSEWLDENIGASVGDSPKNGEMTQSIMDALDKEDANE